MGKKSKGLLILSERFQRVFWLLDFISSSIDIMDSFINHPKYIQMFSECD